LLKLKKRQYKIGEYTPQYDKKQTKKEKTRLPSASCPTDKEKKTTQEIRLTPPVPSPHIGCPHRQANSRQFFFLKFFFQSIDKA